MENKKEIEDKSLRWSRRLSGLDERVQKNISKKYYGGSMPWKSVCMEDDKNKSGGKENV